MRNLRRMARPGSIRQRFILLSILISFVPMIGISAVSTYIYTNATKNYVTSAMQDLLTSIDSNMNIMFSDVKDMVNIVSTLDVVQNFSYSSDPSKWDLMKLMGSFTINKKYIKTILISNKQTMYYLDKHSEKYFSSNSVTYTYRQEYIAKINEWFNDIQTNNTTGQWLDGKKLALDDNAIFYGSAYKNMNTMDYIGMIVIGIDKDIFERLYENIISSENNIVIMNNDTILYSTIGGLSQDPQMTRGFMDQVNGGGHRTSTLYLGDKTYMYDVKTNDVTGWKIVSLVDTTTLNSKNRSVGIMTGVLILLSLIVTIGTVLLSSEKITRQIKLLTLAMSKFGKMEELDFEFDERDEVGKIGSEFQRVVADNKTLTSNLYNAIIKQKEAELQALQSQINPHFLYNTLNSIYLMAEKNKAKNISIMVLNLSKIFRFALNRGESFTIIKDEIKHVHSYLEIQRIRYEDKINVRMEIDEHLQYKKMVKFIIQPLVENAIYHGLEPKEEPGNITISGFMRNGAIVFVIKDDGIGFDSEAVLTEGRGIGIRNVDERIKLYYGDQYGLHIDSRLGVGTEITVTLKDIN